MSHSRYLHLEHPEFRFNTGEHEVVERPVPVVVVVRAKEIAAGLDAIPGFSIQSVAEVKSRHWPVRHQYLMIRITEID